MDHSEPIMKTTEFNEALSQFWEARTAREKLLLG